jgi:hypothetical protein
MAGIWTQWWRLGGLLGIAFIVIFIIGGFVLQGETPTYTDDLAEIRAYWEEDGETYLIGDYLIGLAVLLLFLPFLGALRSLLGLYEGGSQLWSRTAYAAGILFIAFVAGAAASWTALAFAADELEDESIRLLMYFDIAAWNATPFPIGTMLLAVSLVIWQTGVLWKWLAILGFVVGIAALISPLSIVEGDVEDGAFAIAGFISFLGFAIWLLATSIGMLMKRDVLVPSPPAAGRTTT